MSLLAALSVDHLVGAAIGAGVAVAVSYSIVRSKLRVLQAEYSEKVANFERDMVIQKRELDVESKSYAIRVREKIEAELRDRESEVDERERALIRRESEISQREKAASDLRDALETRRAELKEQLENVAALKRKRLERLSAVAGITEEAARAEALKQAKESAEQEAGALRSRIMDEARDTAETRAKKILAIAIQRYSGEYTFESTTATVALLNEDIKGRIIGREGRNIRAFEKATGMTVLIDDTPNAVVISGFDPTRREIARQAMEKLIQDGRIHPTRIEEVVEKCRLETDETIFRSAEEAVRKINVPPLPSEVNRALGNLRFRLSYSQNILDHSVEVASLCGIMAAELKLNVQHAKLAGLLHDIGKAIHQEAEGGHAIVGAEFLKRYELPAAVIDGVASHHDEVPSEGPYGPLVSAADAISASRPGARSETLTTYLKRLERLEAIGARFEGVEKCYAVHAGREVRALVKSTMLSDDESAALAGKIAREIEAELQYPGQIKVTVLRESRWVEVAK